MKHKAVNYFMSLGVDRTAQYYFSYNVHKSHLVLM